MLCQPGRASLFDVISNAAISGHPADLVVVEAYGSAGEAGAVFEPFLPPPAATRDADGGERGTADGDRVRVLGAVVIPGDEVVFYLVSGASIVEVRRAFEARGIDSVRIVAAEWVAARPAAATEPGPIG